ncbi:hypothetical protein BC936DRAFT_138332 [Jimgerdemannia flammicorona]|uniref:Uncharacterized protein n=1 Tax=Jimgerdemannia flammicorona TaxID=994334 RepID=A0A433CMX4_9FUNG|nr:hypothetical protein BC936DRAFT_138332 [Jimgerdemannia flammicorona]
MAVPHKPRGLYPTVTFSFLLAMSPDKSLVEITNDPLPPLNVFFDLVADVSAGAVSTFSGTTRDTFNGTFRGGGRDNGKEIAVGVIAPPPRLHGLRADGHQSSSRPDHRSARTLASSARSRASPHGDGAGGTGKRNNRGFVRASARGDARHRVPNRRAEEEVSHLEEGSVYGWEYVEGE